MHEEGSRSVPFIPGVTLEEKLSGGHQSTVWRGRYRGSTLAFKAVDAAYYSMGDLRLRLEMLQELCQRSALPCAPVEVSGSMVHRVDIDGAGEGFVVAYELAEGDVPSLTVPSDVNAMGRGLARLHASMAQLRPRALGPFAAMAPRDPEVLRAAGLVVPPGVVERQHDCFAGMSRQLLHGDFGPHNIRRRGANMKVFDFDEAGYGAPLADVANTLYLALFSLVVERDEPNAYAPFRTWFLEAYATAGGDVDEQAVDDGVTVRVLALGYWLAVPSTAPPGVAASSPEWKERLSCFVHTYLHDLAGGSSR